MEWLDNAVEIAAYIILFSIIVAQALTISELRERLKFERRPPPTHRLDDLPEYPRTETTRPSE